LLKVTGPREALHDQDLLHQWERHDKASTNLGSFDHCDPINLSGFHGFFYGFFHKTHPEKYESKWMNIFPIFGMNMMNIKDI